MTNNVILHTLQYIEAHMQVDDLVRRYMDPIAKVDSSESNISSSSSKEEYEDIG